MYCYMVGARGLGGVMYVLRFIPANPYARLGSFNQDIFSRISHASLFFHVFPLKTITSNTGMERSIFHMGNTLANTSFYITLEQG